MANKNFLSFLLAGVMSLSAAEVLAADGSVMFKIHDVKAIRNSDNLIESCEFSATFYNNTKVTVSNVNLDLVWKDQVVEDTITAERKEAAATFRGRRVDNASTYRRGAGTAAFTSVELVAPVSLPPLAPAKQITVKNTVRSDRCFMMMGDVEVNIKSCRTAAADGAAVPGQPVVGSSFGSEECNGLFKYYSPKDPEFYTEFKPISYDEEAAQEKVQKDKDRQEVEDMHGKTLSAIRRAAEVSESIAQ